MTLADGLIVWLDPSVNGGLIDLAGNALQRTASLSIVDDTDAGGSKAYDLNGTQTALTTAFINKFVVNPQQTFSMWVRIDAANDGIPLTWTKRGATVLRSNATLLSNDLPRADLAGANGVTNVESSVAVTADVWAHCVFVFGYGGTSKVYVDGVETASQDTTADVVDPNLNRLYLGVFRDTGSEFPYTGKLDSIRVYDRILTPEEVTELYTGGRGYDPDSVGSESPFGIGLSAWYDASISDSPDNLEGNTDYNGTYVGGLATVPDTGSGGVRAWNVLGGGEDINLALGSSLMGEFYESEVFSFTGWIKGTSAASFGRLQYDNARYIVPLYGSGGNLIFIVSANGASVGPRVLATALNDDAWHCIAVRFSGLDWSIWIDGVEADSVAADPPLLSGTVPSQPTRLFSYAGAESAVGLADSMRYYRRELTDSEIQQLYSEGRGYDHSGTTPPPTPSRTFHPLQQGQ